MNQATVTATATATATAEEISSSESKERPLPIEPWVAAGLSRLWQSMKKNIQETIVADKQVQPHTDQSKPASSHNHS
jgi:hypothetical protein